VVTVRNLILLLALLAACDKNGAGNRPNPSGRPTATGAETPAIDALVRGDFTAAGREADKVLAKAPDAARAAAVRAISRYQAAGLALFARVEGMEELVKRGDAAALDAAIRGALLETDKAFAAIDGDLAIAEADPSFTLELCLACWSYDWNLDKEINERDQRMLEIEHDMKGVELPEGDPRRRPTFRLDHGDVIWARAMISFQRALLHVGAAYQWSALVQQRGEPAGGILRVPLRHPGDMKRAGTLAAEALGHADRCRLAYLAETDDDREWVPNPRQKSHPVPLAVDEGLYRTWEGVLGDLRSLLKSETGVPIGEVFALIPESKAPREMGYVDLGRIFSEPRDIAIDISAAEELEDSKADALPHVRAFFGSLWREKMPASPIIGRFKAARDSLVRGEEALDRKLRYLFWFN
jgi:hypothetical protein